MTVHAASRRGITTCGDATPGREQTNVERYPENWENVTCTDCTRRR